MTSPFESAWALLKNDDEDYMHHASDYIERMFGIPNQRAMELAQELMQHQLSRANIPQSKIDLHTGDAGMTSDFLNQKFAKPLAGSLYNMNRNINEVVDNHLGDENLSQQIGQRTSNEAFSRRGLKGNPRVPQMDEEASYANISIPRESPIHGLEPFGENEPMGATMGMPMADDVLEPIRERQRMREEESFNPFTAKPSRPPAPPMPMQESDVPMSNEPMSRGPMRSRKRGDPARQPRFVRPGFRSTESMPLTDKSAESRL